MAARLRECFDVCLGVCGVLVWGKKVKTISAPNIPAYPPVHKKIATLPCISKKKIFQQKVISSKRGENKAKHKLPTLSSQPFIPHMH